MLAVVTIGAEAKSRLAPRSACKALLNGRLRHGELSTILRAPLARGKVVQPMVV